MKHLFVVNPAAGGSDKTEAVREQVRSAFAGRQEAFEVYVTLGPMDAAEKIRREAETGETLRVYACGGDGTFNECVCGAALRSNVAVCPFPTGTGNDFCRMFGEDKDLFRDLGALLDGTVVPIDLIECNGRYSANICSVGIDARIGTSVHKYSGIPLIGGATGYVVSAVVNMFKGISTVMRVRCGSFDQESRYTLVCACNGRYYGGGFNPSPYARPDDGIMDVYIARKVNLIQFAALIGKYAAGKADEMPEYVTHLRTGDTLEIDFKKPDVVNLDGEALYTDTVRMRMVPKALNLIVPRGLHFFGQPKMDSRLSAG